MKTTMEKIVAVHGGEGVSDDFKEMVQKKLGKEVFTKQVHVDGLKGETDFAKQPKVVFCLPGTLRRLRKITKQWPGVRIVMITTEKVIKKLKKVEYVPNIDVWHA